MVRRPPDAGHQLRSASLRFAHPLAGRQVEGQWGTSQRERRGSRHATWRAGERRQAEAKNGLARREPRAARVEAVLLVASEPLTSRKIARFASLADGTEARTLVRRLNQLYDLRGCAFRVEEVAGGFQLLTRARFGVWLRRLLQAPLETRLSGPALETLAVVAYRQAVVRAEVEAIRGVQCGEMLRQLMERDLVRIVGRSDELGRPFLYGTTRRFLQVFGLRDLDELPRADMLRPAGRGRKLATNHPAGQGNEFTPTRGSNEESDVKIALREEPTPEELLERGPATAVWAAKPEEEGEKFDYEEEEDELEDEEEEDVDDDDEEDEDEEFDDDLEEDEWEEVDDDDEEWEDDEEEDEWEDDEEEEEDEDDWDEE